MKAKFEFDELPPPQTKQECAIYCGLCNEDLGNCKCPPKIDQLYKRIYNLEIDVDSLKAELLAKFEKTNEHLGSIRRMMASRS